MKKLLAILMLVGLLAMPAIGIADDPDDHLSRIFTVMGTLNSITNWIFAILMVVAVIFIILAGFQYVTAGGDSDKVKMAWQKIMYAMIGVGVALLARGMVSLVTKMMA